MHKSRPDALQPSFASLELLSRMEAPTAIVLAYLNKTKFVEKFKVGAIKSASKEKEIVSDELMQLLVIKDLALLRCSTQDGELYQTVAADTYSRYFSNPYTDIKDIRSEVEAGFADEEHPLHATCMAALVHEVMSILRVPIFVMFKEIMENIGLQLSDKEIKIAYKSFRGAIQRFLKDNNYDLKLMNRDAALYTNIQSVIAKHKDEFRSVARLDEDAFLRLINEAARPAARRPSVRNS